MFVDLDRLAQLPLFCNLEADDLADLQPHTSQLSYQAGDLVLNEGDRLPSQLYILNTGQLRVAKLAMSGKETILRTLAPGDIFAAPALFGDQVAPASVTAMTDAQVITIDRQALLTLFRQNPDVPLTMLMMFNQRLQQLHDTVHGLVSERAVVRLIHYLQYAANHYGTVTIPEGEELRSPLPHYQIARSIGITYEECVRLFKQLHPMVTYQRGGRIRVQDWQRLDELVEVAPESPRSPERSGDR
ncbi:MAG: Crp/Fnr family transcriptional regulator [Leptolyngbya sp. DLM2.Bin15]|nr:MAG: Crp/Fnr family transcriptional regulator [Leptolyngbya sp. DLM2.Bin15]